MSLGTRYLKQKSNHTKRVENMKKVKIGLVGIGGYGRSHVDTILTLVHEDVVECTAFAEINPDDNKEQLNRLKKIGALHYMNYQDMLQQHPELDVVVISTPISLHKSQSMYAMEQGFHVLLEKPPAVTIQDIDAMIEIQNRTNRYCQVNFLHTSGSAFRLCLQKLQEGCIGQLRSVTGVGMWNRPLGYYSRTPWAGKLLHHGEYVLDGSMTNPLSHLLNNCLIAAGCSNGAHAHPLHVHAECYKGNDIEGEDTVAARIQMSNGIDIRFYSTLCHATHDTPWMLLEGSAGSLKWDYKHNLVISNDQGQEVISFGEEDLQRCMYMNLINTILDRETLFSPLESCREFVLAINGVLESSKRIFKIAQSQLNYCETETAKIKGIDAIIENAAEHGKLFSELGVEWAVSTKPFSLQGYQKFTLFKEEIEQ